MKLLAPATGAVVFASGLVVITAAGGGLTAVCANAELAPMTPSTTARNGVFLIRYLHDEGRQNGRSHVGQRQAGGDPGLLAENGAQFPFLVTVRCLAPAAITVIAATEQKEDYEDD